MNVTYRKGTKEDLPQIMELVKSAIDHMEAQGIMQWDNLYPTIEDFEEDVEANQLFVGTDVEEIAVICTVNQQCEDEYKNGQWKQPEKPFAVIHRLCVNPAFQNRGVAVQTMNYIEAFVKSKGIEAVRLDVYSENPFALRLYQKCGYEAVGTAHWRKGMFWLMEKELAGGQCI